VDPDPDPDICPHIMRRNGWSASSTICWSRRTSPSTRHGPPSQSGPARACWCDQHAHDAPSTMARLELTEFSSINQSVAMLYLAMLYQCKRTTRVYFCRARGIKSIKAPMSLRRYELLKLVA